MGIRLNTGIGQPQNLGVVTLATETLLGLTTPVQAAQDGGPVLILWYVTMTIGTGGTAVQTRLRRGNGLTGFNLLNSPSVNVTAGNIVLLTGMAFDFTQPFAQQVYSLTFQVINATANSQGQDFAMFLLAP